MSYQSYKQSNNDMLNNHHITSIEDNDNDRYLVENRKESVTAPNDFNPTFYNPFEIKRRRRISREQFKKLEKAFTEDPKPNGKTRQKLAESVLMTPRGVQVWFQNRRAKAKQEEENKKKQKKSKKSRQQSLPTVENPSISSHNMVHSRSYSSCSSISCPDMLQNPSFAILFEDNNNNHCDLAINTHSSASFITQVPSQAWHSDTSTVTGIDEDDMKILRSPFTPIETQTPSNSQLEANFCWMDNTNSAILDAPSLNEQFAQPMDRECSLNSNVNGSQGDELLDAWAYIDSLTLNSNYENVSQATLTNSSAKNNSKYLGNELAYNQNVTDWIKTVSLAQCPYTEKDLLGEISTSNNKEEKLGYNRETTNSFMPIDQGKAYWTGQQIMRSLSEPSKQVFELEFTHRYFGNKPY